MASSFRFAGSLGDISVSDAARFLQSMGRTGCLSLNCAEGSGAIHFEHGCIIEAESSHLFGKDAIKLLAVFNQGHFELSNSAPSSRRSLMSDSTDSLVEIMESRALEATQIRELIPRVYEVPRYLGGTLPNTLEVTASELAVVMKASAGLLSVGQIAEQLGVDLLLAGYTIARFRAAGLIEFRGPDEASALPEPAPTVEEPPPLVQNLTPDQLDTKPRYWRGRRIN